MALTREEQTAGEKLEEAQKLHTAGAYEAAQALMLEVLEEVVGR